MSGIDMCLDPETISFYFCLPRKYSSIDILGMYVTGDCKAIQTGSRNICLDMHNVNLVWKLATIVIFIRITYWVLSHDPIGLSHNHIGLSHNHIGLSHNHIG